MLLSIQQLDTLITSWLFTSTPRNPVTDALFLVLSGVVGEWIIGTLACVLLLYFLYRRRFLFVGELVGATGGGYILNEFILKNAIMRLRPFEVLDHLSTTGVCPANFSFPSSHTVVAFAGATILAQHAWHGNRPASLLFYLIAFLIGYSRIYLGCHFVLDVLAGAVVGIVVAYGTKVLSDHIRSLIRRSHESSL